MKKTLRRRRSIGKQTIIEFAYIGVLNDKTTIKIYRMGETHQFFELEESFQFVLSQLLGLGWR